jgi:hypothetical protein
MRAWLVAVGLAVLVSGVVLYVAAVAAAPPAAFGEPVVCHDPTTSVAECRDAIARLDLMGQLQPVAYGITAVGAVVLMLGIVLRRAAPPPTASTEVR